MKKIIGLILLLALAATPAFAGTIDFENMPQDYWYKGGQKNFGDYWQGVNFGPESTILESQVYGYNSGGYPAHSGNAVLFSISLPYINAVFDTPVNFVSMYYSTATDFVLDAYDANNNLITSAFGGYNLGSNSFISVSSETSNIKWVKMHDSGNYFTIDDFTAPFVTGDPSSNVPEPSSFALIGLGLAGLGLARRKFRK